MFGQKVSIGYLKGCMMNEVLEDDILACLTVLCRGTDAPWSGLSNNIFSLN